MGQPAENSMALQDFPGLMTHIDAHDLPRGAAVDQVNLQSTREAMLSLRPGYRRVTFEEE